MSLAVDCANKRYLYSLITGGVDTVNSKGWMDGFSVHLLGCIGEISVSKAAEIPWPAWVNRFKSLPDLGNKIEVRHRSKPEWELIVRKEDNDKSLFVLSRGLGPDVEVVGFIPGRRAKQKQWEQEYGGKRPAYFVPDRYLLPIEMLKEEDNR